MNVNIYSESESYCRVPTKLAESAVDAFASTGMHDELDQLNEILAEPAEQRQGEPVAWQCSASKGENGKFGKFSRVALSRSEMLKFVEHYEGIGAEVTVTALYTHADPGEVERLREEIADLLEENRLMTQSNAVAGNALVDLRAQLAERHERLAIISRKATEYACGGIAGDDRCKFGDEIATLASSAESSAPKPKFGVLAGEPEIIGERCKDGGTCHHECTQTCFRRLNCGALTGSGLNPDWSEPSAPVERDERAAFEADCLHRGFAIDRLPSGEYLIPAVRFGWEGWQARAALERKP